LFLGGSEWSNQSPRQALIEKGAAMGKFFLIMMAVSIAVLLALSVYVISL
jgi:hypothetical protein